VPRGWSAAAEARAARGIVASAISLPRGAASFADVPVATASSILRPAPACTVLAPAGVAVGPPAMPAPACGPTAVAASEERLADGMPALPADRAPAELERAETTGSTVAATAATDAGITLAAGLRAAAAATTSPRAGSLRTGGEGSTETGAGASTAALAGTDGTTVWPAMGAAGVGGKTTARGGRRVAGSTYPSAASEIRIPRWTYGVGHSLSPLWPARPTVSPSTTVVPFATESWPRWVNETAYPSSWIVTVRPEVGTTPANETTPDAGARTGSPSEPATSTPRCWPAAYASGPSE
jgi:hypothetical protein